MDSEPGVFPESQKSVELVEAAGEWFVRTLDGGRESVARFQRRERAEAYAQERAAKLGVQVVIG